MSAKLLVLPFVISFLFVLYSNVEASNSRFYDWGPWYESSGFRSVGRVLAEATGGATPSPQADIRKPNGLLPDSPFYILKTLGETLPMLVIFDAKARETAKLHQAEERLAETKALLERQKYPLAAKNLLRYQKTLESISSDLWRLKQRGLELEDLAKNVELVSAKHSLVLEKLFPIIPQSVEYPAEKALRASQKGMDVASDVLGRETVPVDLKERLESLRALGILRSGEVEAIFILRFRDQVREGVERLSKRNLIPEADAKRLDEAQNAYFPADYLRVSELKKIQEFKNLEELKPDEATINKIEEFSATYKPGEQIPPDLRQWWVPLQRYQELSETIRPDLVIGNILPKENNLVKVDDLIDLFKPTGEQIKAVDQWVRDNPGRLPPPEIQRVASLAVNLGAQVNWRPPENLKKVINSGFPAFHSPPVGFSGLGTCATENSCRDLCKKNPFACVGSSSEKKEELARKIEKISETPNRKESSVAYVPEKSPLQETPRTLEPSSGFISPNEPTPPPAEPLLRPSPSGGYFGSGFATRVEEKISEEPTREQTPTTGEVNLPSPEAQEISPQIAQPPPTPLPLPETPSPIPSPQPSPTTPPAPLSGLSVGEPTTTPEPISSVPPPVSPARQAGEPPERPTEAPRAPEPYCLETQTKARHDFTGEVRKFHSSCLPTNWHPYLGPEKSGEVYRPKSSYFRQIFKRSKRYFNR